MVSILRFWARSLSTDQIRRIFNDADEQSTLLALLLTQWIHNLEMAGEDHPSDSEEAEIVSGLKCLLAEMDFSSDQHDRAQSLVAMLARAWASFLDNVCEAFK